MTLRRKDLRKGSIAVVALAAGFYFVPYLTLFIIATGSIDVMRNERKTRLLFDRYFLGNGVFSWFLSPINLLADLLSEKNKKVYRLDDLPAVCRREVEGVLATFAAHKADIIADIDRGLSNAGRGMYVFRWYGKPYNSAIPEFNGPFEYIQTIAVSVFTGKEATSFHFGPLRFTLRVLYNLTPVDDDQVYIECGNVRHIWRDDPLFIFDDTLLHRSVNLNEARRYCVFMDIVRPSPLPGVLLAFVAATSIVARGMKGVFYRNWKMLGTAAPDPGIAAKP